ncbi:hypothetical protein [Micromonospora yangpuensis]|uniref:AP2/ERF domain-containing protein n=1 Tax=Micromonospora yangpuensis TaxID=683228 RepID=A0A1C6U149_9ACTN|nr:hypothetical protein [Micromonospora yangpuensis]GGM11368.1 hypothetical protein GCM10012279_31800 [Micromonospora yangpuensis]SCL47717.1 hypothetical protein GA0070617_0665 [Micromonospora yangpuensis]
MQTVLSAVLIDVPQAAAIWLALIAVVATTVAVLVLRPGGVGVDVARRIREAALPSTLERAEEDRDRERYAAEVAVAAERAVTTAQRHRAEWLAAQDEVEAAWQAYQDVEADVQRLSVAAALPLPRTVRTPAEYADRERFLHRTALDAYWRRELSVEQLSDVFAHRNGWDPRRHPVEQELFLRRAVLANLQERHRTAQERERAAWQAAELAVAAAGSLRQEAFAATEPAPESEHSLLPGVDPVEVTAPVLPAAPVARGRAAVPAF